MDIFGALSGNALISGGAVLMLFGGTLAYFRSVPQRIYLWVKSRFIFSVEVQGSDQIFDEVTDWLENHASSKRSRSLAVKTKYDSESNPYISFSPIGINFFRHNGRLLWVSRSRDKQNNNGMIALYETISVSTFARGRGSLEKLFTEIQQFSSNKNTGKVLVYACNRYIEWNKVTERRPRPLESVILESSIIDNTYHDLEEFIHTQTWYQERGIPYRRGYLLYGSPGNGKTSLIFALASVFKKNIAILNLASGIDDAGLLNILSSIPKNSFLLIEDIDSAFKERKAQDESGKLTFSGLLNALDGVATPEGRVIFMTTNNLNVLDSALIRPGRVDKIVNIDNPKPDEIKKFFLRFFPSETTKAEEFSKHASDKGFSMAKFQEILLKSKTTPDMAISALNTESQSS